MHFEQGPRLGGRLGGEFIGQRGEIGLDLAQRAAQTRLLGLALILGEVVADHIEAARLEHPGATDDDPAADAGAAQRKHQISSPNPEAIRSASACAA